MQESVRRSLAWMTLAQGGMFILQFGGSVAIARLLTPYEMGVCAIAYAFAALFNTMRSFGLGTFLIREASLNGRATATTFTLNMILALATTAAILTLTSVWGGLVGDGDVQRALFLLGFIPLVNIFEFLPSIALERTGAFRAIAIVNLGRAMLSTVVTIYLAYRGSSYMSIVWGNIASSVFSAACMNLIGRQHASLRVSLHDWRRVTKFGLQMLAIGAVSNVASRLTDLLLGRIINLSSLGLYSRASGLNSLLWDNLHLVIARIVFVDFAERKRRSLPLGESYLRIVSMITGLLWPAFAGLAILSGPVIYTIYGDKWILAALPLSFLSMAGIVMTSATMASEIYNVCGNTDRLLRYEFKRTVIGLSLFSLGCLGGLNWAAFSRIGDGLAVLLFCKVDLQNMTGTRGTDYTPIYLRSAVLTIGACGPVAALMYANEWSVHTPLPAIFLGIAIGVTLWISGLKLMHHPLFDEIQVAVRHVARWRKKLA